MLSVWDVMQRALTRHVSLAKDECFAHKRTDMTQPLEATPASFAVVSRMNAWPVNFALALAGGLALRFTLGLAPVWWVAWLAPVPLLVAVMRAGRREAWLLATLAGLIGASVNIDYLHLLMGMPAALGVLVVQALIWTLVLCLSRQVIARGRMLPAVLAYPLLWAAVDLLSARFLPDGNWGSLGYSQSAFLPAAQVVALGGVPLLAAILSLPASALAVWILRGRPAWKTALAAVLVAVASLAWGEQRLAAPMAPGMPVGLASIDDAIGPRATPDHAERIWRQYEQHIASLAARGARIVVLPEKIAMLGPGQSYIATQQRLARAAAQGHVWLAAGIGFEEHGARYNRGWLFAPSGALVRDYEKQKMAPPEREFVRGHTPALQDVEGKRLGLAICKDMHFAEVGRGYAQLAAQAMAVPAWDFGVDGRYAARLSALRGIEGGFAMARASRDGLLTVTDAYGRIVAETATAPFPGVTLLARFPDGAPPTTLYARIGDAFGWLALGVSVAMLAWRGKASSRNSQRKRDVMNV
jgi:apolipoprotein N-acyltransferase